MTFERFSAVGNDGFFMRSSCVRSVDGQEVSVGSVFHVRVAHLFSSLFIMSSEILSALWQSAAQQQFRPRIVSGRHP